MRSRRDNLKTAAVISSMIVFVGLRAYAGEEGSATGPAGSGFTMHLSKITALKKETDELEEKIKKLIEEKREANDEQSVRNLTNEINEKFRELEASNEKLEAEEVQVRFHYPEQTEKLERKYVRFKKKTLKDLESEAGIDGRLDRIHEHVLATFPVPELEKAKEAPPKINPIFIRKPASLDENEAPEKIILTK